MLLVEMGKSKARSGAPAGGASERSELEPPAAGRGVEVPAKPERRRFSAEYKRRIVEQAERLQGIREIGSLLRRDQLRHPAYEKPELLATSPNQVWSWDITRLKGPTKWSYFYLYVMLDIFSRFVVGWMLAERENAHLAKKLIATSVRREGICRDQLTLHSDRGAPMKAQTTTQLLAHLGVEPSFNRPRVSNDNPFSEAQFKTVKYHPTFPRRFGSYEDAHAFCRSFFHWYNEEHRHGGIAYLTPAMLHSGDADRVVAKRARTLEDAYARTPERFVHGVPKPRPVPAAVWINPPSGSGDRDAH